MTLIAHSIGSEFALQATDACPDLVATHVLIEGDQSPFANDHRVIQGMNTPVPYHPYGLSNIPLNFDPRPRLQVFFTASCASYTYKYRQLHEIRHLCCEDIIITGLDYFDAYITC